MEVSVEAVTGRCSSDSAAKSLGLNLGDQGENLRFSPWSTVRAEQEASHMKRSRACRTSHIKHRPHLHGTAASSPSSRGRDTGEGGRTYTHVD